jgi:hypothetical protein
LEEQEGDLAADSVLCFECDEQNTHTTLSVAEVAVYSAVNDSTANDVVGDIRSRNEAVEKRGVLKCSYCKCGKAYFNEENWALIGCANTSCKKQIHRLCFEYLLSVTELQFKVKPDIVCCAIVRCCSKFKQQSSDWICDAYGPNGPNTLPKSQ